MRLPRTAATLAVVIAVAAVGGCARPDVLAGRGADPDSIPTAFARPQAALMWPGATTAFQVRPDGSLYNGAWSVVPVCTAGGDTAGPPRAIAYEERWCPVARWHRTSGSVRWDFEAVAFPASPPADTLLFVSLAVRATNTGRASAACTFACTLAPPPAAAGWVAPDGPPAGSPLPAWGDRAGAPGVAREASATGTPAASFALAPGAQHVQRIVLAGRPASAGALAAAQRTAHARRVEAARAYWRAATSGGLQLQLGDPELETALRAARVVLLSCRERHRGQWLPTGGPFQYHDTWLRDGARAVAALSVAGDTRAARELAGGLALFQWPQGPFLSQRGQLDGNGQALWAFAQAQLRPAPDSALVREAQMASEACAWVNAQREMGAKAPWPLARLLPYADPRDGELVRAQLVGNDAWALAGFAAAARLLRAAHREADAERIEQQRAAYAADFRSALARLPGAAIPPSWQGAGRDWGNLAVGWPCLVLPARDARLAATAARAWSASEVPGLTSYGAPDSIHGYVGADLGTWALLAGRPADAERVLAALLHWRDATGAGAELFSASSRDYGLNVPPHPTSAAALVVLARNMLVYDDGDTLQLTLGARARWWRGAHVGGASTRWGTLELAFERHGAEASWRWTAVPAWTALTLPPGTVLAAAPGAPCVGEPGGRTLLAPPGTTSARAPLRDAGAQP